MTTNRKGMRRLRRDIRAEDTSEPEGTDAARGHVGTGAWARAPESTVHTVVLPGTTLPSTTSTPEDTSEPEGTDEPEDTSVPKVPTRLLNRRCTPSSACAAAPSVDYITPEDTLEAQALTSPRSVEARRYEQSAFSIDDRRNQPHLEFVSGSPKAQRPDKVQEMERPPWRTRR